MHSNGCLELPNINELERKEEKAIQRIAEEMQRDWARAGGLGTMPMLHAHARMAYDNAMWYRQAVS